MCFFPIGHILIAANCLVFATLDALTTMLAQLAHIAHAASVSVVGVISVLRTDACSIVQTVWYTL